MRLDESWRQVALFKQNMDVFFLEADAHLTFHTLRRPRLDNRGGVVSALILESYSALWINRR